MSNRINLSLFFSFLEIFSSSSSSIDQSINYKYNSNKRNKTNKQTMKMMLMTMNRNRAYVYDSGREKSASKLRNFNLVQPTNELRRWHWWRIEFIDQIISPACYIYLSIYVSRTNYEAENVWNLDHLAYWWVNVRTLLSSSFFFRFELVHKLKAITRQYTTSLKRIKRKLKRCCIEND